MKNFAKVLAVIVAITVMIAAMSVSVFAAASPAVLKTLTGAEGGNDFKDAASGTMPVASTYKGHVWGYNFNADLGFKPGDIIKIGFVVKINSVDETAGIWRLNPFFKKADGSGIGEVWADYTAADLTDYVGKTVVVVGVFTVPEGCGQLEGRIWHENGSEAVIQEVVLATNGYNFQGYKGFDMVDERADNVNDTNAVDNMETVENNGPAPTTEKPADNGTKTQAPSDNDNKTPATADPSIAFALIASAAAAFGGLKLRKK